jgi:hypothetical protein
MSNSPIAVSLAGSTFQLRMKRTWKAAQRHTDSFDICTVLEEFHNVDVADARGHMQCGVVALIYRRVENETDLKDGAGTY